MDARAYIMKPDDIREIDRPDPHVVAELRQLTTASVAVSASRLAGMPSLAMRGITTRISTESICGPAVTLRFNWMRSDLYMPEGDAGGVAIEYENVEEQLHRHALFQSQSGDVVVVDGLGDESGVFGDNMLTFAKRNRKVAGIVVDGCIRDSQEAEALGLPIWTRGVTPDFHAQHRIVPTAVNVLVNCFGVSVLPGDLIHANQDGVVVIPAAKASEVLMDASTKHWWEPFSRDRLLAGEHLRNCYPCPTDRLKEAAQWCIDKGLPVSAEYEG